MDGMIVTGEVATGKVVEDVEDGVEGVVVAIEVITGGGIRERVVRKVVRRGISIRALGVALVSAVYLCWSVQSVWVVLMEWVC